MRDLFRLIAAAALVLAVPLPPSAQAPSAARPIAYVDIQPLLAVLRPYLPFELVDEAPAGLEAAWPGWVARRDVEIRGRVTRGDEDSVVNLWLFGTSFTSLPPARPADVMARAPGATLERIVETRLDDLLDAAASPGTNERLQFVRRWLDRRNIAVTTTGGRARARDLMQQLRQRMVAESAEYLRVLDPAKTVGDPLGGMAAYASLYQDRGLSSDTSMLSSYAVEAALADLKASGLLGRDVIRRVAIVGPGLDFVNKADGHDFYPEQTIQPFAVIDSLLHLELSQPGDITVTTFDVSARVNEHLVAAGDRARRGGAYVVQLPLTDAERWSSDLLRYWERLGSTIGETVRPARVPPARGAVKVRAVAVRPAIVGRIVARDLNVVLERLEPREDEERFDLVVATNVLAYYGTFEQALAVVNIARMLRPGGSLLANQAVLPVAPMQPAIGQIRVVYSDRQYDHVLWYRRR